ncbi:hypothetical protein U1Q18_029223 [Sarracenia purpurea var. burkii]
MASSYLPWFLLVLLFLISLSAPLSLGYITSRERERRREGGSGRREGGEARVVRGGRRVLTSLKETPSGGNLTFECAPSGPCISCLYSEKNDEKYRCSETGYRIPLKCVEITADSKEAKHERHLKSQSESKLHVMLHNAEQHSTSVRHKGSLVDSSISGSQAYITYRSCVPAVNDEKLSVLGFEGVMLGLLFLSSSVLYFKRKRSGAASGGAAMRIPSNPRF